MLSHENINKNVRGVLTSVRYCNIRDAEHISKTAARMQSGKESVACYHALSDHFCVVK